MCKHYPMILLSERRNKLVKSIFQEKELRGNLEIETNLYKYGEQRTIISI